MTLHQRIGGNALPVHIEPERFQTFAAGELAAAPPWQPGICFNPACSAPFVLEREWQVYCCDKCAATGANEMRKWGHKMALPLLVWRTGKYMENGSAEADLARAARRYVTRLQSAWLADRNRRMEGTR